VTIPKPIRAATQRVSDLVRQLIPRYRYAMNPEEAALAVHLRGNEALFETLKGLVQSRMAGRAGLPEPTDPLVCKSMLARDRELQWFLSRLEFIYHSPVNPPAEEEREQPA